TPTRRLTELVARALLRLGVRAAPYHAGLTARTRREVLRAFLADRAPVVVATSAFGMGIDKPDVRRVLHWGPPRTVEAYYQEAGRAGRDGRRSDCVMVWRPSDFEWGDAAAGMRRYVETRACRRGIGCSRRGTANSATCGSISPNGMACAWTSSMSSGARARQPTGSGRSWRRTSSTRSKGSSSSTTRRQPA